MRCCRSDWPGLCLFCCYQHSFSAKRVDLGFFVSLIFQFYPSRHYSSSPYRLLLLLILPFFPNWHLGWILVHSMTYRLIQMKGLYWQNIISNYNLSGLETNSSLVSGLTEAFIHSQGVQSCAADGWWVGEISYFKFEGNSIFFFLTLIASELNPFWKVRHPGYRMFYCSEFNRPIIGLLVLFWTPVPMGDVP